MSAEIFHIPCLDVNIYLAWDAVFHHQMRQDWKTEKRVENTTRRRSGVFLTNQRCFIWWWNIVSQCLILLLKHWKWLYKKKSRMQKWAVFHLISKHSLNINFLCIFFLTYQWVWEYNRNCDIFCILPGITVRSVAIQWWETNSSSSATCLGIEFTLLMRRSKR